MAAKGRLHGVSYGPDQTAADGIISGSATLTMNTLNNGAAFRFMATQNKDVYGVRLPWNAVATPGQVAVRIETIDPTTGKPTGTAYDANAVITGQTPTVGVQTFTFASHPTTKLTPGAMYAVVVLTTTAGTTQTLRNGAGGDAHTAAYPISAMSAADGTTRTNFAEINSTVPVCTLVLDDGTEDSMGMVPYSNATTSVNLITNAGKVQVAGLKLVTDASLVVAGIEALFTKTGTPTADLRGRILDSGNNVLGTVTMLLNSVINGPTGLRQCRGYLSSLLTLPAGTYRVVFDGAADTSSANCFIFRSAGVMNGAANAPSGFSATVNNDFGGAGAFADTTDLAPVRLLLDDLTASGSAGMLFIPDLAGT